MKEDAADYDDPRALLSWLPGEGLHSQLAYYLWLYTCEGPCAECDRRRALVADLACE